MEFNKEQLDIINSLKGAYLVSAPVGTGKTTILTERVIKALKKGFKPEEVLCLTFTNRAAEEMTSRIRSRLEDKKIFDSLTIKTFHGFCAYFIKEEAKELGISPDFVIFDNLEQVEAMKEILEKYSYYIQDEQNMKKECNDILEKIYKYRLRNLENDIGCTLPEMKVDETLERIADDYKDFLYEQHALDFNELVLIVIRALYTNKKLRDKWSSKYKFIQLDEFQDTHISEYLVVKELAKKHGNVSFIGDLDQTIYGWRGSEPYFIKGLIKKHFPDHKQLGLKTNYRFDPNILSAVKSFLSSFAKADTKDLESSSGSGSNEKCIDVFSAYNFDQEIDWVVENIKDIRAANDKARIAVLSRANYLITKAAEVFSKKGVSHITVDKYEFFRKQEVKDIYAYLKIIFNRFDLESAYRLIKRPPRNIGPATINDIREKGESIGLKVSDLLNFRNFNYPEPYYDIINRWDKGRIVVLDTETTGTNPVDDEVIQIFAIEIVKGKPGKEFYHFLKNKKPVGLSENVHGISDEHLADKGRDPKQVLKELKDFIGQDVTVGHNVVFDLSMLSEYGKRMGVQFDFKQYYDTLDMSRRSVDAPNYKLGTLSEMFSLETATHDAKDDVLATVGLLEVLVGKLRKNSRARSDLFKRYSGKFVTLAGLINSWQTMVCQKRPGKALKEIWENSGLKEYYEQDKDKETRSKSIEELISIFKEKDDPDKRPETVMRELIHFASLVKDINFLGLEKGKVPIVTAHQVKGLEFDHVFIVGLNEFSFPNSRSDLEEEKRLFYVAMTRARKHIYLSYSKFSAYDRPLQKSRFIDLIDESHINFIN